MVEILGEPHKISLVPVGTVLSNGDAFGTIEGFKMTADLLTPVSGLVIEIDQFLLAQSSDFGAIPQINEDPYNSGWMVVIQLNKPQELTRLLTWQKYRDLIAK